MPRNGAGVMSWPPNGDGVPNTTIESAKYNAFRADLLSDLNAARPVAAGGTGATTAAAARTALGITLANLNADAVVQTKTGAYTAVLADRANLLRFTTAATLSLTAAATLGADWFVDVKADGVDVTVDPNAAETIDGSATIVIPAGMSARIFCTGAAFHSTLMTTSTAIQVNAGGATLTSTDAGATAGPKLDLYRNSATPADGDVLGSIEFNGKDESGNKDAYASIEARIADATGGTEDGEILFSTAFAGTKDARVVIGQGAQIGSPTGGDRGTGTLNATGIFVNNVAVLTAATYAALSFGAVGTNCFCYYSGTSLSEGGTISGSSLQPAGFYTSTDTITDDSSAAAELTKGGSGLSGTWRAMGRANKNSGATDIRATLFVRIS